MPPGVEGGFLKEQRKWGQPATEAGGAHPGGAGLGTGVKEEGFSLTLDFYAPVLFATKETKV